jgi:hypothetical protein
MNHNRDDGASARSISDLPKYHEQQNDENMTANDTTQFSPDTLKSTKNANISGRQGSEEKEDADNANGNEINHPSLTKADEKEDDSNGNKINLPDASSHTFMEKEESPLEENSEEMDCAYGNEINLPDASSHTVMEEEESPIKEKSGDNIKGCVNRSKFGRSAREK